MAVKKRVLKKKETPQFSIDWVDIDSISLWEDNPRMNDEASKKLASIIEDHGIKSPIVCWDKNRVIYKGNTTYKACKLLGYEKVPVVFHTFKSEVSAKAYGIADNKASEMAEWDEAVLYKMMNQKEFKKAELNTGFSDREVELLDFWPPSEEREQKAKVEGKTLSLRIVIEVTAENYQALKEELKNNSKVEKVR